MDAPYNIQGRPGQLYTRPPLPVRHLRVGRLHLLTGRVDICVLAPVSVCVYMRATYTPQGVSYGEEGGG